MVKASGKSELWCFGRVLIGHKEALGANCGRRRRTSAIVGAIEVEGALEAGEAVDLRGMRSVRGTRHDQCNQITVFTKDGSSTGVRS